MKSQLIIIYKAFSLLGKLRLTAHFLQNPQDYPIGHCVCLEYKAAVDPSGFQTFNLQTFLVIRNHV